MTIAGTRGRGRAAGAALLLVLVVAVGACSQGRNDVGDDEGASAGDSAAVAKSALPSSFSGTGGSGGSSGAEATGAVAASADGGGTAGGSGTGELAAAPLPQGLGDAKVVKSASLQVEVKSDGFAAAFSKVPTIAAANGGFVASSSSLQATTEGQQSAGSLVVRVPADRFDAARQQLIDLGKLRSEQLQGEDVGGKLTDLDARLRNLRSHEEALARLMTKAGTIGETIEVQRQLSAVREQIEQLAGEQARLNDAVAFSTLTLSLAEPGAALNPEGDRSPLGDAWAKAVDGAESVLAGVVVTVGYVVPLALLAGLAWLVARPFLHRRREGAVVASPSVS